MTPHNERDDATHLRDALNTPDPLTHTDAETLIALLVEAEAMGADVDDDPTFAPLFQHLDHCADCLALYEAVSEDYAATLDAQTTRAPQPLPVARATPAPTRRTFEFVVRAPHTGSPAAIHESMATYRTSSPRDTFADFGWQTDQHSTTLNVVVHPPFNASQWQIEAHADGFTATTQTDQFGVATFHAVPDGVTLTLVVREMG